MFKFITAALLVLSSTLVHADEINRANPYQMIEQVADKTFKRVKTEQNQITSDREHLRVIVQEELMPYVDSQYAALKVLGPAVMKSASKEQVKSFISAFDQYLVATYASVFTMYKEQKVEFEQERAVGNQKAVVVRTKIVEAGRPEIVIDFKVRNVSETWKAFDMVAEGISLLDAKRAELADPLRIQGIEAVTTMLLDKAKAPIEDKSKKID